MKKVLLIAFSLLTISMLTGCGAETLTCTKSDDNEMMKMEQKIIATFKKDKAKTVEAIFTIEADKSYENYMDELKSSIEEEMDEYEKTYDVDTKIDVDGTTLTYQMKADSDKMSEEARSLFGFDTEKGSKEDAQKQLEDEGYTCK